jgi:transglutaminase-like putative cysteine protease
VALSIYLLLTAFVSLHSDASGAAGTYRRALLANRLMLQALPVTVMVVLWAPAGGGPLWTLPVDAYSANVGLGDGVAPGSINKINRDESVAFRVKFHGKHPDTQVLYWRGPVFTYYDGQGWSRADTPDDGLYAVTAANPPNSVQRDAPTRVPTDAKDLLSYTVTLEPHNQYTLFSLGVQGTTDDPVFSTPAGELVSADKVNRALTYTLKQSVDAPQPAVDSPFSAHYLRLPNLYAYNARRLAAQLKSQIGDAGNADERMVNAVLDYFRGHAFYYTKQAPLIKYDPVDEFLFKTRKGYCEHYASAFVFLMRAAGIPARVVAGYYGGEYNSVGDYYVVRQSQAHAWAEVWVEQKGWLRVDPTAVIPDARVMDDAPVSELAAKAGSAARTGVFAILSEQLSAALDNVNYQWTLFVVDGKTYLLQTFVSWMTGGGLKAAAYFVSLLFCFVGGVYLLRGRIGSRVTNRDPVVRAYTRFCVKLQRAGLARLPGESASVYAERVSRMRPGLKEKVLHITGLYNQLRYAGASDRDTVVELRRAVSALRPEKQ